MGVGRGSVGVGRDLWMQGRYVWVHTGLCGFGEEQVGCRERVSVWFCSGVPGRMQVQELTHGPHPLALGHGRDDSGSHGVSLLVLGGLSSCTEHPSRTHQGPRVDSQEPEKSFVVGVGSQQPVHSCPGRRKEELLRGLGLSCPAPSCHAGKPPGRPCSPLCQKAASSGGELGVARWGELAPEVLEDVEGQAADHRDGRHFPQEGGCADKGEVCGENRAAMWALPEGSRDHARRACWNPLPHSVCYRRPASWPSSPCRINKQHMRNGVHGDLSTSGHACGSGACPHLVIHVAQEPAYTWSPSHATHGICESRAMAEPGVAGDCPRSARWVPHVVGPSRGSTDTSGPWKGPECLSQKIIPKLPGAMPTLSAHDALSSGRSKLDSSREKLARSQPLLQAAHRRGAVCPPYGGGGSM